MLYSQLHTQRHRHLTAFPLTNWLQCDNGGGFMEPNANASMKKINKNFSQHVLDFPISA